MIEADPHEDCQAMTALTAECEDYYQLLGVNGRFVIFLRLSSASALRIRRIAQNAAIPTPLSSQNNMENPFEMLAKRRGSDDPA
jgi:hypothetical protein